MEICERFLVIPKNLACFCGHGVLYTTLLPWTPFQWKGLMHVRHLQSTRLSYQLFFSDKCYAEDSGWN